MSVEFVRSKFAEYYSRAKLDVPDLRHREFGFGVEDKIDFRHKAFQSAEDLNHYLVNERPLYASYSAAHYELPDARPMPKKNLLGADLVFDIDAPSRKREHAHNEIWCDACLESVREDGLRLLEEFLLGDFGFSKADIETNFSGQKGFHFHVRGGSVQELSQNSRRQLVEYLLGPEKTALLLQAKENAPIRGPAESALGWGGKFYAHARRFLSSASLEDLRAHGLRGTVAENVFENRALVLRKMAEGNWDAVKGLRVLWERLFEEAKAKHAVSVDAGVSLDIARLIRLPDSLHGSTGFIAKKTDLKDFRLEPAFAFSKEKTINVVCDKDVGFELGGMRVGLREGKPHEVPLVAGVFLLCRKRAKLLLGEK